METSGIVMQEKEYEEQVDRLFFDIEDCADLLDADLDIDSQGGMLTIGFPDGSSVILSRQVASQEVWVAARSGGYHLAATDGSWMCRQSGETLPDLLNRVFSEQLGEKVECFTSAFRADA